MAYTLLVCGVRFTLLGVLCGSLGVVNCTLWAFGTHNTLDNTLTGIFSALTGVLRYTSWVCGSYYTPYTYIVIKEIPKLHP